MRFPPAESERTIFSAMRTPIVSAPLSGNLCRCTGYLPIIAAVLEARAAYRKADKS